MSFHNYVRAFVDGYCNWNESTFEIEAKGLNYENFISVLTPWYVTWLLGLKLEYNTKGDIHFFKVIQQSVPRGP